jgi:hypothetical protein
MMEFLVEMLSGIWETTREMSPFLLFGFLVAGILYVFVRPELVERHLGGRGVGPVIKAALLGVPLPLCSCGVIPVAASLRRHGAGKGATTSFLISTPQTGVDSIMVTLSLLGPIFALFRPLFAFVSGIVGGGLVSLLDPREGSGKGDARPTCIGCESGEGHGSGIGGALRYGFRTLPRDINRALIVGVLLAGLIGALVPDDFFASILGGGIAAMLVMMAVGIPVYVCATASVPIAAALIAKGISPGGALVFLMTGPATNAATILTVTRVMGRRTAAIYLGTVALCAIGGGLLIDAIYQAGTGGGMAHHYWMLPGWLKSASAAALAFVIAASFISPRADERTAAARAGRERIVLKIKGMHCEQCVRSVTRALGAERGVASVSVDLAKGEAVVTGDGLDEAVLAKTVEELGYMVAEAVRPGGLKDR